MLHEVDGPLALTVIEAAPLIEGHDCHAIGHDVVRSSCMRVSSRVMAALTISTSDGALVTVWEPAFESAWEPASAWEAAGVSGKRVAASAVQRPLDESAWAALTAD